VVVQQLINVSEGTLVQVDKSDRGKELGDRRGTPKDPAGPGGQAGKEKGEKKRKPGNGS